MTLALSLVIGSVVSTIQAIRAGAEARRADREATKNFMSGRPPVPDNPIEGA